MEHPSKMQWALAIILLVCSLAMVFYFVNAIDSLSCETAIEEEKTNLTLTECLGSKELALNYLSQISYIMFALLIASCFFAGRLHYIDYKAQQRRNRYTPKE